MEQNDCQGKWNIGFEIVEIFDFYPQTAAYLIIFYPSNLNLCT